MLNAIYGPPATIIIGSYALAKEEIAVAKEIELPEVEETAAPNVEEAVIEIEETEAAPDETEASQIAEDQVIVFIVDDLVAAQVEETVAAKVEEKAEEKAEEKSLVTERKANEIVQAFLRGLDVKNLSKAIALIKACQNDGTWQEVRALVNATLGLFFTVPVQDRLA